MKSKILVATHINYTFPNDDLYQPIRVGKALSKDDFEHLSDESGENISTKNRNFSELTALYWAWKNNYFRGYDYCGLVHYRRYFKGDLPFGKTSILSEREIENYLETYDVVLPRKRKYYVETVRDHYAHAHHEKDLDALNGIILEKHPEYINTFDAQMNRRELYLYNMFVIKKELFDNYMEWLFDILFELEKRVNISEYDNYQARVFGFLAERLFNVWLQYHQLKTKEVKVVNLEGENLILKAVNMLKRKYLK